MEFSPNNKVVMLCLQGMQLEESGKTAEARSVFRDAWNTAEEDLEKFLAAFYLAKGHGAAAEKLEWLEKAFHHAAKVGDPSAKSAYPSLYEQMALCYKQLSNPAMAEKYGRMAASLRKQPDDDGPFYHGTKASLKAGDLLMAGGTSNYKAGLTMNHIYFTALMSGAGLAAALARGDGPDRVYRVEPTGPFENDPNVTDKKFPGNPTRSYRSEAPLKIVAEETEWSRPTPQDLQKWRQRLANVKGDIIN